MDESQREDKLFTVSYICSALANFLMFFCFYLLMPILALYLKDAFDAENQVVGIVLSCYTVAALAIRPFSGYLVDTFARKPLYLGALFFFILIFAGYPLAGGVLVFAVMRIMHGLAFGMATIAGNTIVIDIMPSSRRGEGLGYYGLSNNIAMAIGPMVGMYLHDHYSYNVIFYGAFAVGTVSLFVATQIQTAPKPRVVKEPISLDRFILKKGIPAGINLLLLAVPYGITTSYIALYGEELGINTSIGLFYCFMAVGIALSRLFSGKQVDKGRLTQVIALGASIATFSFFLLPSLALFAETSSKLTQTLFYVNALLIGIGYGTIFPATNALFVGLAPNNKRGTANSTYLSSWDIGIGIGLLSGGYLSSVCNFSFAFLVGGLLDLAAVILFVKYTGDHFHRNKIKE
ncbi:MAG: MFS transporter [Paludibacteraceae bacterium]|nr:MFS transporter [Paludibacteraceae bacterium]